MSGKSANRKKDTHRLWIDLTVFAVVVAFFGFSATHLFRSAATPAHQPIAPTPNRAPASPAEVSPARPEQSTLTHHLTCFFGPPSPPLTTSAALLRIEGTLCHRDPPGPSAKFRGTNRANGEDIVSFIRSNQISTNYFALKEGKNSLEFELEVKGKTLRQDLEVVRTPRE